MDPSLVVNERQLGSKLGHQTYAKGNKQLLGHHRYVNIVQQPIHTACGI